MTLVLTHRRRGPWLAITIALLRSWRRMVDQATGGSKLILAGAVALAGLLLVGWSTLVVGLYHHAFRGQPHLNPDALANLNRIVSGANTLSTYAIATAGLLAIVALSPSQTAVHSLVATRPVRPWAHLLGQSLPLVGASVLATLALNGAGLAVYLTSAQHATWLPPTLEAIGLAVGVLAGDVAMLVAIHAATAVSVLLGIHADGIRRLFGLLGGAILLVIVLGHDLINLLKPGGTVIVNEPAAVYHRLGGGPLAAAVMLAIPVLILLTSCTILANLTNVSMRPATGGAPAILSRPHLAGGPRLVIATMVEMRVLIRHPVMLTNSVMGLILTGGLGILVGTLDRDQQQSVMMIVPMLAVSLAGLVAEGAYGRTLPWHSLYRHQPCPDKVWFWPKLMANMMYAVVFAAVSLLLLFAFVPDATPAPIVELIWFTLLFPTSFLAGVVLPYRDDVPLGAALTSALALSISIAAFIGFTKLGGGPGAQIAFGLIVGSMSMLLARRISR